MTIIQGRLRKLGKAVPEAATSEHLAATLEALDRLTQIAERLASVGEKLENPKL